MIRDQVDWAVLYCSHDTYPLFIWFILQMLLCIFPSILNFQKIEMPIIAVTHNPLSYKQLFNILYRGLFI